MTDTVPCIATFCCHKREPLPILSVTTLRTPAEPGQGLFQLNLKHHSKLPPKTNGGAGTKLCCQIEFAQKCPKGAAVIWHTPGLIRHYLSSKGSVSVMSRHCRFPGNKTVKKHAANSPVSMNMESWPKSSFVWVFR